MLFKVIHHLFHGNPLDALVFVDMFNDSASVSSGSALHVIYSVPFMHKHHMRPP